MTHAEIAANARKPYADKIRQMLRVQNSALDALLRCRAVLMPMVADSQEAMDAYNATTNALLEMDRI